MKKYKISVTVLILFFSCSKSKNLTTYYQNQKVHIDSTFVFAKGILSSLNSGKITIRYSDDIKRIMVNYTPKGYNRSVGAVFFPKTYAIDTFFNLNSILDDGIVNQLRENTLFPSLLKYYMACNARAVKITNEGLFIAIMESKQKNHGDYESGLFLPFSNRNQNKLSTLVAPNVYAMDDRVE